LLGYDDGISILILDMSRMSVVIDVAHGSSWTGPHLPESRVQTLQTRAANMCGHEFLSLASTGKKALE